MNRYAEHSVTTFSGTGDSGSIIVDARGSPVALLTAQTSPSFLTFGTPMFWLWDIILSKFPDAALNWDNTD